MLQDSSNHAAQHSFVIYVCAGELLSADFCRQSVAAATSAPKRPFRENSPADLRLIVARVRRVYLRVIASFEAADGRSAQPVVVHNARISSA
jgi:hypothetical protein